MKSEFKNRPYASTAAWLLGALFYLIRNMLKHPSEVVGGASACDSTHRASSPAHFKGQHKGHSICSFLANEREKKIQTAFLERWSC